MTEKFSPQQGQSADQQVTPENSVQDIMLGGGNELTSTISIDSLAIEQDVSDVFNVGGSPAELLMIVQPAGKVGMNCLGIVRTHKEGEDGSLKSVATLVKIELDSGSKFIVSNDVEGEPLAAEIKPGVDNELRLGRSAENTSEELNAIKVDNDMAMSAGHLSIGMDEAGKIKVTDLHSTNGTRVLKMGEERLEEIDTAEHQDDSDDSDKLSSRVQEELSIGGAVVGQEIQIENVPKEEPVQNTEIEDESDGVMPEKELSSKMYSLLSSEVARAGRSTDFLSTDFLSTDTIAHDLIHKAEGLQEDLKLAFIATGVGLSRNGDFINKALQQDVSRAIEESFSDSETDRQLVEKFKTFGKSYRDNMGGQRRGKNLEEIAKNRDDITGALMRSAETLEESYPSADKESVRKLKILFQGFALGTSAGDKYGSSEKISRYLKRSIEEK